MDKENLQTLFDRGELLQELGLTSLRTFRRLRREFPNAEWDELHFAAGFRPTGKEPLWVGIGRPPLNPVTVRRDPRKVSEIMGTFKKFQWEKDLRAEYERQRALFKARQETEAKCLFDAYTAAKEEEDAETYAKHGKDIDGFLSAIDGIKATKADLAELDAIQAELDEMDAIVMG